MRFPAVAALALLALTSPALAQSNVGVTAAVNQSASGTLGSNVRTISLGDNVIYNERIQTNTAGLLQILLADGTTFMVGPGSDLVIDSFVYDPNAGTAQVTASFTKGVLRFIGGQTSKTEGGVTLNTPVGTMGIRGAMVDVVLDPPAGTPPHIDMLFGNEVTLQQGRELLGRLYAAGYSLVLGADGRFEVMKTPPGWSSQIQAALAGKLGTKGGAPAGPTDSQVQTSEVAENNSGNGFFQNTGEPLTELEQRQLIEAVANYDEIRDFVVNNPPEQPGEGYTQQGFSGAMLQGTGLGEFYNLPGLPVRDEGGQAIKADVVFDADGEPNGIAMSLSSLACDNCEVFIYDSTSGEVRVSNGETTLPFEVQSASVRQASAEERSDLTPNCNCDFIKWGFWNLEATATLEDDNGNDETVNVSVIDGTWVTGDLTTVGQLDELGGDLEVSGVDWSTTYATYAGNMVGTVHSEGNYTASGTFNMDWNFGDRNGQIQGEFNGSEFYSGLTTPGSGTGFSGTENQYGPASTFDGAFVNNGGSAGAGVIGNFTFIDESWYGSGVFMGARGDNQPYQD